MHTTLKVLTTAILATTLVGCIGPIKEKEAPISLETQKVAQETQQAQLPTPVLKRKIALGRITNETSYGKSLLRDSQGDPLGKQTADMLAKALRESNQFTVLERTDLASLSKESQLTGNQFQAVGADVLVIGSITEFGRRTDGVSEFWRSTKSQIAYAKMDVRLVDTSNGVVIASFSGAGEARAESGSILGYGARTTYDGTLNDKAISLAVSDVVSKMVNGLANRPWRTAFLTLEPGSIAISGGTSQGLKPGMELVVKAMGKSVKSAQTGFNVQLPGQEIARIRVIQTFGDTAETEGSLVQLMSGSLAGQQVDKLIVEEIK